MAALTAASRKALRASSFVFPTERRYPIHDEAHARNALSRVAQHGTPAEKAKVRAAVHRKFPAIGRDRDRKKHQLAMTIAKHGRANVPGASPVTPGKAREMLHHGSVHGHALTKKQRGMFGAIAHHQSYL